MSASRRERLEATWQRLRGLPLPFWVMFADTFVMAVGFYLLIPLFAYHLLENVALSATVVGVIAAVRSFSQQGMMVWSGALADRIGYRNAICAGVLIRAAGFGLFGIADSVPVFLVGSVLAGFGGSLFHPASYATYAVLTATRDRVTIYSVRELLSNGGFILGPVVGGLLLTYDFRWVCFVSAGLFAATSVLTWFGLPALRRDEQVARSFVVALREVASNRTFLHFTWVTGGAWALVSQLYLAVPVRAGELLADASQLGRVYAVGAIVMVLTLVPLSRIASQRLHAFHVMAIGTLLLGGGLLAIGFAPVAAALYVGVVVFTLGQVLCQPMMNNLVSRFADPDRMASFFGVNGLALAVGGVVGNIGGGALYQLSQQPAFAAVPWLVFGCWAAGVAALYARAARTVEPPSEAAAA
ncbi:MFS transporter [Egicoccus sp. AB-alg6-2]|uniref:MFS transporter n=1 Tax=Egicoccus sp. AB-alg6-2 TaxID=3242692 RepID=UPI00359EBCC5